MNITDRMRSLMTWLLDEYNNNPGRVSDMYDLTDLPDNRGIYGLFTRNLISLLNRNSTPAHPVLDIRDQMSTGGLNMTVKEEQKLSIY